MIGGLTKTTSSLAVAAVLAAFASHGAMAADLGGNCCSDLEERVAELEATTARKGNRRVSLEVSGHVNEAIVFWDVDSNYDDAFDESNVYIGTHNSSRSRFRFKGSAKIDADWSAGFLMEFGVRANHLGSNTQYNPYNVSGLDIRHEALYLKSNRMGTVWLGWTSSATDGITEICLGCGLGQGPDYSDDMGNLHTGFQAFDLYGGGQGAFVGEGDRREVVRYISPEMRGFVFSAAYGQDDFYDVALRYANEWNGVRVAAGVGYQHDTTGSNAPGTPGFISSSACGTYNTPWVFGGSNASDAECEQLGASISAQHVPSGIYGAAAYGHAWDNLVDNRLGAGFGNEVKAWSFTGGVNRKFSPIGATNIWGMYTYSEDDVGFAAGNENLTIYGVGVDQKIDAAAMTLYFWWKRMEAEYIGFDDGTSDQFVLGSIIRF